MVKVNISDTHHVVEVVGPKKGFICVTCEACSCHSESDLLEKCADIRRFRESNRRVRDAVYVSQRRSMGHHG